jgi:hypothetical protein
MTLPIPGGAAPAPPKPGLNLKVAGDPAPKGGKPPVVKGGKPGKPGKIASVLKKRAALSPVAKAGIGVVVIAIAIAGVFFYKIFFPAPSKEVVIKPIIVKPVAKEPSAADVAAAAAKAAADAQKAADALAAKRAADAAAAAAAAQEPTPTPATESVMADASLTKDVKVNTTRLEAAPAASAAFRTYVAGAEIGGVFQGTPSRALINGTIFREGQVVENQLGIIFDRIDADKKVIYFKDTTGAEVSKNY